MKDNPIDYDKGNALLDAFKSHGITHNAKSKHHINTLDFQDFVGRMTPEQINIFYESLDQDQRKMFLFGAMHCLDFDSATDIIRYTTIAMERRQLYKDFDDYASKRELEIYKKQQTLEQCRKPIFKRFAKLNYIIELRNGTIERQKSRISELTEQANKHYKETLINQEKAFKYDLVKEQFQRLQSALAD